MNYEKRYELLRDLNKNMVLAFRDLADGDPAKRQAALNARQMAFLGIENWLVRWEVIHAGTTPWVN